MNFTSWDILRLTYEVVSIELRILLKFSFYKKSYIILLPLKKCFEQNTQQTLNVVSKLIYVEKTSWRLSALYQRIRNVEFGLTLETIFLITFKAAEIMITIYSCRKDNPHFNVETMSVNIPRLNFSFPTRYQRWCVDWYLCAKTFFLSGESSTLKILQHSQENVCVGVSF